jgi:hypothetical protein
MTQLDAEQAFEKLPEIGWVIVTVDRSAIH